MLFIDTKYSNHLIASRAISEYAKEHIINYEHIGTFIAINSNLIGVTPTILEDFMCIMPSEEVLVGILDEEICLLRIKNSDQRVSTSEDEALNMITETTPSCQLYNKYSLQLLNSVPKLAKFEREIQDKLRQDALNKGVFLQDPSTTYLSFDTKFGKNGIVIEPNVYFGPKVVIHDEVRIKAFCYIEDVEIGTGTSIGPFARIRGRSTIGGNSKVGNFVEIKNSTLDKSVKAGHLAYIGDTNIGESTNIGAGVVTCNYDGKNKYKTIIGANSFIGSNTALIAPVEVGSNTFVGAGSVINKNVPNNSFAISRSKQEIKPNKR